MYLQLLLLIFLIFLSGAFSGAEIALTALSPAKVRAIGKDNKFGSRAIAKLKSNPQRLLITILIGNNLVNILATVLATIWAVGVFGSNAIGIVTGLLTFLILVFGEITPKTFAQKYSERFARALAHPLLWLTKILFPVIWIFEKITQGLISGLKLRESLHSVSEDELLALVDIGAKEGVIEEQEQEMIENVLEFTDTTVEEVMTIKKDIEMLKQFHKVEREVMKNAAYRMYRHYPFAGFFIKYFFNLTLFEKFFFNNLAFRKLIEWIRYKKS